MKLDLPSLLVVVMTIQSNTAKHAAIRAFLESRGYKNVQWHYGRITRNHHEGARESASEVLGSIVAPTLWLEDDTITTDKYMDSIDIPDDSQVAYLGGSCMGATIHGKRIAKTESGWMMQQAKRCIGGNAHYTDTADQNWVRLISMLSGHAILWLDTALCRELSKMLTGVRCTYDHALALNQWRYRVYCIRYPWFIQSNKRVRTGVYCP